MVITAYGIPLALVTYFNYLGRVLSVAADDDWPAVVHNLQRERQKWARLYRVLRREGAYAQTPGRIYVLVVQVVMMYGSETWVTTPRIGRVLDGFHHMTDRRLTVRQPQKGLYGGWLYPPLEDAVAEEGLQDVET